MRIHIIGGPGSGKTTLAKHLSTKLEIPSYEMDLIGWEGGFGLARPLEARLHDISMIAAQTSWVTEGDAGTLEGSEMLLQAADHIIWLDLSWPIARWRIIKRHALASWKGNNKHRGLLKLWHFLQGAHLFYTNSSDPSNGRMLISSLLAPYSDKVIHCRRPSEVVSLDHKLVLTHPQ